MGDDVWEKPSIVEEAVYKVQEMAQDVGTS